MMRGGVIAMLSCMTFAVAADCSAQSATQRRDPPPHFTIAPLHGRTSDGLALPPIGLQLPPVGLPPREPLRTNRPHAPGPSNAVWPFFVPVYLAPSEPPRAVETVVVVTPPPAALAPPMGTLLLNVEPQDTQVFADGAFVGTVEDLRRHPNGLVLEAGRHRIDFTAPGGATSTVDVRITEGQSVTYTRTFESARPAEPAAAPPPAKPSTFYLIPGCYLGNVHPQETTLAARCDLTQLVTATQ